MSARQKAFQKFIMRCCKRKKGKQQNSIKLSTVADKEEEEEDKLNENAEFEGEQRDGK